MRMEINRARLANRVAREALKRIIDEQPGPQTLALLVAKIGAALGENQEALQEIEKIILVGK